MKLIKKNYMNIHKFFPWIYKIIGLKHIVRKFQHVTDNEKFPTGFLWILGIYFALYQVAFVNYQGAVNPLNRKVDQISVGVDNGDHKYWLSLLPKIQSTPILIKPDIWSPLSTIKSLIGSESQNPDIIRSLKEVVESLRHSEKLSRSNLVDVNLQGATLYGANFMRTNLYGANLANADLREADLEGANLSEAILDGADFTGATNLNCQQMVKGIINQDTILPAYLIRSSEKGLFFCDDKKEEGFSLGPLKFFPFPDKP
jgi:hypothetical protein